ncbi:MAG: ATP synthase F1 subunit delta [Firmicutes bacterium]|nr:ATP synthase F1 subunit delta [Bacillota bacterium]
MLKGAVAGRYAEALYEIAVANEVVDKTEEELRAVVNLLEEEPDLKKVLYHPRITATQKKDVLKAVLEDKISQVAMNFLCLIVDRQREVYLASMLEVFVDYANRARNISDVEVTSAIELSKEDQKRLINVLGKVTGKEVRVSYSVDPSLIGGVVARIGDKVIDGSVKSRLESLREHLRQIS